MLRRREPLTKKRCRRSKWIPEKEQAVKINYKAGLITIKRKGQQEQTLIIRRLRHPSQLCTVCTEENLCPDTHSLPHLITHSNWKQQEDSKNENSLDLMDADGTSKKLPTCSSSRAAWLSSGVLYSRWCWNKYKREMGTCFTLCAITNQLQETNISNI